MRRTWRIVRHEREGGLDAHPALLAAPFLLLFGVFIGVKSADSSASFHIDERVVLENLKQKIAETTRPAVVEQAAAAEPAPGPDLRDLREVREVVRRGDTFGGI